MLPRTQVVDFVDKKNFKKRLTFALRWSIMAPSNGKRDKELIMKVYTLLFFGWTDTEFGGVFSTKEAAMARGDEMEEFCTKHDYDYQVIESEIDVPVETE